eukprot:gene3785-6307_t
MNGPNQRMVWVDLEMSGLDITRDRILEVAMVITEADLTVVAETNSLPVWQPDHIIDNMDEWNTKHHNASDLVARVRSSKLRDWDVENQLIEFLQKHVPKGKCPLAGSSVHVDRQYLLKFMPRVIDHLHYRIIDVSSLIGLAWRWNQPVANSIPSGKGNHTAVDDIHDSIEKLSYLRKHFIKLALS